MENNLSTTWKRWTEHDPTKKKNEEKRKEKKSDWNYRRFKYRFYKLGSTTNLVDICCCCFFVLVLLLMLLVCSVQYNFIAKCQYNCARDVPWCHVHSATQNVSNDQHSSVKPSNPATTSSVELVLSGSIFPPRLQWNWSPQSFCHALTTAVLSFLACLLLPSKAFVDYRTVLFASHWLIDWWSLI